MKEYYRHIYSFIFLNKSLMLSLFFQSGHGFGTQSFGNLGEHPFSMVGISSEVDVESRTSEVIVESSSQKPSGRNVPFVPKSLLPAKRAMSIQGTNAKIQKNIQNNTSFVVRRCFAFFRNSTSTKKNAMLRYSKF